MDEYERQCDLVVRYIKEHGSITQNEAGERLGIGRLASRISDLKKRGYDIRTTTEHGKNRYGRPTHWARYRIEVQ